MALLPRGVTKAPDALAISLGDVHVAGVDPMAIAATLTNEDSIVNTLRPAKVLSHDVLDFRARNHHETKNPDAMFRRAITGEHDIVEDEVRETIEFIDRVTPDFAEAVIIPSNHDDAFDRWLREANPKTDPHNAIFYHRMRALRLESLRDTGEFIPAFQLAYDMMGAGRAHFVPMGASYMVAGIENQHGHLGPNGSRGSAKGFDQMGCKSTIGHIHAPEIWNGVFVNGTLALLRQGYNLGPSSWMHASTVTYGNGKRSLFFVRDGFWRV